MQLMKGVPFKPLETVLLTEYKLLNSLSEIVFNFAQSKLLLQKNYI